MMDRVDFTALVADAPVASDDDIRAYEARMQRETWRERLAGSGIDGLREDDREAILGDRLHKTAALDYVQRWIAAAGRTRDPGPNMLVVCGGMGLGKTVAAGWAISRHSGLYATVETYLRDFERWYRDRSYDDRSATDWRTYKRSRLVVIDEIGTEYDAALMARAFERLVDSRQSRRRELTLMLGNLSKADFVQRIRSGVYGARTYDRMRRDAVVVEVTGDSMRKGAW
jgi:DNA replication protein DnaC